MDGRSEELIINMIEWAIDVSADTTRDLIRASGITSEELSAIGYDVENFPELHSFIS